MNTSTGGGITKSDSAGLLIFIVAGIVIAGWAAWAGIARIIELARGTNVPVEISFVGDTEAMVATNDGSSAIPFAIDNGRLLAPELPTMAKVPGIIGQIILLITVVLVIACLIALAASFLKGKIFSRRNTRLVTTAGFVGLLGFAAARFFDNMLANATVHAVTDNRIDTAVITVEPFTFVLAAFVISVVATAFTVGARLQRETEGLV